MTATDPRIAALYDGDNPDGPDHDHWRRLVAARQPRAIADLGCGTGMLTVTLAAPTRTVVGIDPDSGMLDIARNRPGSQLVTWILGDANKICPESAEVVLMTGNVAQHIGPRQWQQALIDIATGLRAGGVLSFESRNPDVRAWNDWANDKSRGTRATPYGPLTEWMDVSAPDEHGTVLLTAHNLWEQTGEDLIIEQPLTFRSSEQITDDLQAAGLVVTEVVGDWGRGRFTERSTVTVLQAERRR